MNEPDTEIDLAVRRLSALAHPTRLKAFRLLMESGPTGLRAGVLSSRLKVAANTMSAHFSVLSEANLVKRNRVGRTLIYSVNIDSTAELMRFLASDCCGGHPEICAPLGSALQFKKDQAIAG